MRERRSLRRSLTAAAVLAAAVAASAHEEADLTGLRTIDALIDGRLGTTTGGERRAYAKLARSVRRPNRPGYADDLAKVVAVRRACDGSLSADADLRGDMAATIAEADAKLAGAADGIAAALRRLERAADRSRVQALSDAGVAAHAAGSSAADDASRVAQFLVSAKRFTSAQSLAARLVRAQVRRGSPGQPLAKGPRGTIDTFAGTGLTTVTADGAPALDANLYFPMDVAIDPATGLVHIVDYNDHAIRRIDADGRMRTVVKSTLFPSPGPGLPAPLDHPASIAFDPLTGDLYVAGWHSQSVFRVAAGGSPVAVVAGGAAGDSGDGGPAAAALLNYPSSVAFDASGRWFVSDQFNQRIRLVDAAGDIHAFAGDGTAGFSGDGGPALAARLSNPSDAASSPAGRIAVSPDGASLFVADTANHRVRRIDLLDAQHPIATYAGTGTAGTAGDGGPATAAELDAPVDLDFDASGNLLVCDAQGGVVRRIDSVSRVISTIAGVPRNSGYSGDGRAATSARLKQPSGIFMDRVRGRLYIADTGNSVVRVVWE